jgi:hypothetical protein|nr:MAG TPA_asm: hypothetical protein [Caudoviricetes sp.]
MKKNNRLTKSKIDYFNLLDSYNSKENLYAPAIDAELAINVLCQYLLGEDYYIEDPLSSPQADTIIVQDILHKYCNREVTKDYNKYKNAKEILNQE